MPETYKVYSRGLVLQQNIKQVWVGISKKKKIKRESGLIAGSQW